MKFLIYGKIKNVPCFSGVPSSVLFEKKHMGGFHLGDGLEK
jgi:hypothetical protein